MSNLKEKANFFIGWPLSIAALFFISKFILDRFDEVSENFDRINIFLLFLSVLLFIIFFFLRTVIWKLLLKYLGHDVGLIDNSYRYSVSELKRYVPGNVWSFLARGVQFNKLGVDSKTVGKGILFEIELTILGAAIASAPAIFYILSSPQELRSKLFSLLPVSAIAIFIFIATLIYLSRKKFRNEKGLKPNQLISLTIFSSLIFIVFGFANYFAYLSVFPKPATSEIELLAFFSFAFLMGYLSFITPMGLGVREGVLTLGLLKITSLTNASFFAIFSRVILIVSELIYVSIVFLLFKIVKQNR